MKAGIYARVSHPTQRMALHGQLQALRTYCHSRGWDAPREFTDFAVSGGKDSRPGLNALLLEVAKRKLDVVVCTRLDRIARSVQHLVRLVQEFHELGVQFVVIDQAIDTTTSTGRLLFHVMAAIAEFELDLIRDRVVKGMERAKERGAKIGRPRLHLINVSEARRLKQAGVSLREIAKKLGVPHPNIIKRALEKIDHK